ncbi:MAG: D-alanine--D-alanine ligase [Gammaproteobacteria bacterium]|nr:D-alanine--D-alanine ligase [Gammaproteobacteria bacterium]
MAEKTAVEPVQFGKVAVLCGGCSAEREISLNSGRDVAAALCRSAVDAHVVDSAQPVIAQLQRAGFDRAFIMLHGRGGEDGVIQGALQTLGLPYTGSAVLGSALSMDKPRCKALWMGMGVPTPRWLSLHEASDSEAVVRDLGLPIIVKPAQEGSSLGMSKVTAANQLASAWRAARHYDEGVIAEQWIEGKEYTAAVLVGRVLPLIRIETARDFYDYDAKYVAEDTRFYCPSGLSDEQEQRLQAVALRAFETTGAKGWGRVDFICDAHGAPWFIEVNTVPGMTDHSLVPMAAKAAGIGFDELVMRILATTL